MDYAFLREEGLKHIQKLAGEIWTDYNIHDPGITILEMLCYAITDLGYRTNNDIKDILASQTGENSEKTRDFFIASEILPNNPLTIEDYRKLIIDFDGIKNGWMEINSETEKDIYINDKNEINYTEGDKIKLKGIINFRLEFDKQSLNSNIIKRTGYKISNNSYDIEIAFPYWDELPQGWNLNSDIKEISIIEESIIKVENVDEYNFILNVEYNDSENVYIKCSARTIIDNIDSIKDIDFKSIIDEYNEKLKNIDEIKTGLKDYLNGNRNLCEDFREFKAVRNQDIAIKADIEVSPETDPDEVLEKIYYHLYEFFKPDIKLFSLKELLDKGKTPDEIFAGPLLNHGFIESDNLKILKRKDVIYTSDLVNVIMNIGDSGIIAVKNLTISNYIDNREIISDVANCLKLAISNVYQPVLNIEKSVITISKSSETYTDNVKQFSINEKIQKEKIKWNLEIPIGEDLHLDEYYPIQNHFPLTYGIGEAGLPQTADDKRKAHAKQLKAYLLFFEQLLANYFSQLAHVKDLFSIEPGITNTYFSQTLNDIPDIGGIIEKDYLANINSYNVIDNEERRNRFLNHLLARFCENFTEYSLLMFAKNYSSDLTKDKIDFLQNYPELSSKRGTAFNYKAKDNRNKPDVWDTENVSGPEKRISRLLGLENYGRRNLSGISNDFFEFYHKVTDNNTKEYRFRLLDEKANILLSSSNYHLIENNLIRDKDEVIKFGINKNFYQRKPVNKRGKFYFNLVNDKNEIISRRIEPLDSEEERENEINRIIDFLSEKRNEGFYLIEHLLLRPKINKDINGTIIADNFLLPETNDYGNLMGSLKDPYSFIISVVLPKWIKKFSDPDFKRFTEKVIREEIPAHIMCNILWVNNNQMTEIEKAYKNWLILNAFDEPLEKIKRGNHLIKLNRAKTELLNILNKIKISQ